MKEQDKLVLISSFTLIDRALALWLDGHQPKWLARESRYVLSWFNELTSAILEIKDVDIVVVVGEVDTPTLQAMLRRSARGREASGAKKERRVANVSHLAPFLLREIHHVGADLLDALDGAADVEEADEEELPRGFQQVALRHCKLRRVQGESGQPGIEGDELQTRLRVVGEAEESADHVSRLGVVEHPLHGSHVADHRARCGDGAFVFPGGGGDLYAHVDVVGLLHPPGAASDPAEQKLRPREVVDEHEGVRMIDVVVRDPVWWRRDGVGDQAPAMVRQLAAVHGGQRRLLPGLRVPEPAGS